MTRSTRKKLFRRLLAGLLLLGLVLLVGPAALGRFAPSLLVAQLLPELADRIDVQSIRLSWTEPVVIEGVTVRDDAGRTMADIPRIATDYTLGDWLRRPDRLGTIELVKPHITLRRSAKGWNVQRLVEALRSRPAGKPVKSLAVKLTDGRLLLLDETRRSELRLTGMQSQIRWEHGQTEDGPQGVFQGDVSVDDVTSRVAGVEHPWDVPLQVAADVRWTGEGPTIRSLMGTTPFGRIDAKGDLGRGDFRMTVDFERLHTLVGQILLPSVRKMAGAGAVTATWQPDGETTRVELEATAAPIVVDRGVGTSLQELRWRLEGSARIRPADKTTPWTIDAAAATLDCDGDSLHAETTAAIPWHGVATRWSLQTELEGRIEEWLGRWNALVPSNLRVVRAAGMVSGVATVSLRGVVGPERLRIERATGKGKGFRWTAGSRHWEEPIWNVVVRRANWNFKPAAFDAGEVVVQTTACSARLQNVSWDRSTGGLGLRGAASIRAALEQIAARLRGIGQLAGDGTPRGQLVAKCVFRGDGSGEHVEGTVDIDKLHWSAAAPVGSPDGKRTIPIGKVHIDLRGMRESVGTWRAEKLLAAVGDGLRADLSGYWKWNAADRPFALTGTCTYDLARIRTWWPALPSDVQFSGKHTKPVSLKGTWPAGSPWSAGVVRNWEGSAELAWDRIESYGFQAGPGTTRLRLHEGIVSAERTTIRWPEGHAEVEPRLSFGDKGPVLELVAPTRVERLTLTPAMCGAWLQYVLPLAADAARAEGQLSLDVARCRVPFDDLQHADIEGTLTVHRGKIGPSAEVRTAFSVLQFAQLLREPGAALGRSDWIELPAQRIACRLSNGFVSHRGLRMRIGPLEMASAGRVGLDESIDVKLNLHVSEQAARNRPLLAGLRGRDIEVPLRGTLKKPRLKSDAVRAITRGLLEAPANDLLRRGIDRLFPNP